MNTTHFENQKMELVLPVFFGCMGALFFCVLVSVQGLALAFPPVAEAAVENVVNNEVSTEDVYLFFTGAVEGGLNPVYEMYHDEEKRPLVIDFFAKLCGSREIAEAILANADAFNIQQSLAFALAWEESRFKPTAVGPENRDKSIDRGLFQLNSKSFPLLEPADFFNIKLNAWYSMGHLRFCLNTGGSEIAALAMYNAGTGKVQGIGTPKVTLDYIHRILQNRAKIEERFRSQFGQEPLPEVFPDEDFEPVRLSRLAPL